MRAGRWWEEAGVTRAGAAFWSDEWLQHLGSGRSCQILLWDTETAHAPGASSEMQTSMGQLINTLDSYPKTAEPRPLPSPALRELGSPGLRWPRITQNVLLISNTAPFSINIALYTFILKTTCLHEAQILTRCPQFNLLSLTALFMSRRLAGVRQCTFTDAPSTLSDIYLICLRCQRLLS